MRPKLDNSISEIFSFSQNSTIELPLFSCGVSAGFPSPAEDYIDRKLDLNELLIHNPAATFFVRVSGDYMTGASINHNDILIIDRSLEPLSGKIVIAVINGELTIKRLIKDSSSCRLAAENPNYEAIEITDEMAFEVWGVVTSVIHQF